MALRTYPLIVHPAFLSFVEHEWGLDHGLHRLKPVDVPAHRPELRHISDIAEYLKVSPLLIRSILLRPDHHYRSFRFNKKAGGVRVIHSPRTFLKVVQWWILDTILTHVEVAPIVNGFVPNKSFVTNAREHLGAKHVLNIDVKDFFPSIKDTEVKLMFADLGYSDTVSKDLASLITLNGSLPQGAPTSPMASNLVIRELDRDIMRYAQEHGLRYTRYADDITLSSSSFINKEVLDFLRHSLGKHGLQPNPAKTRYMGPQASKEITGLVLGEHEVRFSRSYLNGTRGWFHRILVGPQAYVENVDRLRGTVALIRHVGGAGSKALLELGHEALQAVEAKSRIVATGEAT